MSPRIRIYVGAYGSGKSEIALETALQWAKTREKVAIADLDLVNPYFRSRESLTELARAGVELLAPPGPLAGADLPIIVPQVRGAIEDPSKHLILDVGGDDAGSRALGTLAPYVEGQPWELWMVVNNYRPFTSDLEGLRATIERVEGSARLKVTHLVANPNLGPDTDRDLVEAGAARIAGFAEALGVPLGAVVMTADIADQMGVTELYGVPVIRLSRRLAPAWYEDPSRLSDSRDRRAQLIKPPLMR
ncbi:MAG: cobalamin biosynthesis protein CbiA [Deltaproteobacteria bacterium]|nr:cobalamin biosynthesis protein CbiA [Deltaproteobacteria bacterium]